MAGHARLKQILYRLGCENPSLVGDWRAVRDSYVDEVATNPANATRITSATVDGNTYAGAAEMSVLEHIEFLDSVLAHLDAGVPPASRTYATF